ncbi:MAG: glucokinase [Candidatus Acidiferrales bacterium]|jgi:glucokinase
MILGGDVGGTKCNLALFEPRGDRLETVVVRRYPSNGFDKFEKIVAKFLEDARAELGHAPQKIEAAGFGVAGPVVAHRVKATNLPWVVDGAELAKQLGTRHIVLLNDLEACGYSIELLRPAELATLNAGQPAPRAAKVLIAAGTGLGEAILYWDGTRYFVASSEGGHADLAPRTEQEIELLRYLKKSEECVSWEMILSGRGFLTIHNFLDPSAKHPSFDQPGVDAAPEITEQGLAGTCAVCVRTLDLWTAMYGAEAGNMALRAIARNGVYIAGGIAVKILPKLKDGTFFRAFCHKAKFGAMLAQIPVHVVLNEKAPLLGAATQAARSVGA